MKCNAVIFDIDGTLISVGKNYSYIEEFHDIFRGLLKRITGKDFSHLTSMQIYDTIRLPYDESVKILSGWGINNQTDFWKTIEKDDFRKRKSMINDQIFPYSDAIDLLKTLKGNGNPVKLGILSNAPESVAMIELGGAGFMDYFDFIYTFNYNSPHSKPSGWGIKRMLSEWEIPKENAWMFGDAEQDVEAGKDAGIHTGQVLRENHPNMISARADIEGKDLSELWRKANEM